MDAFVKNKVSALGLLKAAFLLCFFISIISYFSPKYWAFELLSHLRLQYLLCIGASLIIFIVLKEKLYEWLALLALAVNIYPLVQFYYAGVNREGLNEGVEKSQSIKLMLSNVLSSNNNYRALLEQVKVENPDVLILQEVTMRWLEHANNLNGVYPYTISQSREDNFGIALFSKFPLDQKDIANWGKFQLPSIETELVIGAKRIKLIATHPVPPLNKAYHQARNLVSKHFVVEAIKTGAYMGSDHLPLIVQLEF